MQDYSDLCDWVELIDDDLTCCKESHRNVSGINKRNAGHRGYAPSFMFKINLIQRKLGLSDKNMFKRLHDSCQLKQYLGIKNPDDIPSKSTICNYRKLFAQEEFMDKVFPKVTAIMQEKAKSAIREIDPIAAEEINRYIMVDSTVVTHSVTRKLSKEDLGRIKRGECTCEELTNRSRSAKIETDASWTFKNQEWRFGFKQHVGADVITNVVVSYTFSTASIHDVNELCPVVLHLPVTPNSVVADAGYISQKFWQSLKENGINLLTARKRQSIKQPLPLEDRQHNSMVSALRYGIEHVFAKHKSKPDLRVINIQQAKFQDFLDIMMYNVKRAKSILRGKVKIKRYRTRILKIPLMFC